MKRLLILFSLASIASAFSIIYSEQSPSYIYSNCNFSNYNRFQCSTQLNPPLFIREKDFNGTVTYVMNNDDSFFYSSSDGNGVISILQQYSFNPITSIHVTTLYNDNGPTYVINEDSLEICERNPIQTSSYRSVYPYVYDALYIKIDQTVVEKIGPYHCKNMRVQNNILGIIYYYDNKRFISIYDITLEPIVKRATFPIESNAFEFCISEKYIVFGYHYPQIYVYYPSEKKYLYSTNVVIDSRSVLSGCQIVEDLLYISTASTTTDTLRVYSLDNLPFPLINPIHQIDFKFDEQYRNTIASFFVKNNYITLSTWGDSIITNRYPQFYIYTTNFQQLFNYTMGGSMLFTDIRFQGSDAYFLVGGQKGHSSQPSKGGEFYLFREQISQLVSP